MLLNSTVRGAPPDSASRENEAAGGTGVGAGIGVAVGVATGEGVGIEVAAAVGPLAVVGAGGTVAAVEGRVAGVGVGSPQAIAKIVKIITATLEAVFTSYPIGVGKVVGIYRNMWAWSSVTIHIQSSLDRIDAHNHVTLWDPSNYEVAGPNETRTRYSRKPRK